MPSRGQQTDTQSYGSAVYEDDIVARYDTVDVNGFIQYDYGTVSPNSGTQFLFSQVHHCIAPTETKVITQGNVSFERMSSFIVIIFCRNVKHVF
jgi:hypothetical protein